MGTTLRHELQTPTFAFTLAGIAMFVAYHLSHKQGVGLLSHALLMLASGGLAIALWDEVKRKEQEWGWRGLATALRRPSPHFWHGFLSHLPQFVLATYLTYRWWKRTAQESNPERQHAAVSTAQNGG